ncbi:MAG: hypothetical protein NXI01_07565 [Gammaproteobacteria bacterium]|nr:hypothetical protein [Gammaproteobacteria bacterium]
MSELLDDKAIIAEDNKATSDDKKGVKPAVVDARRRLEALIEEKRLQDELDDWV